MSWVSALPMCQEMSMVMATEAYEINKSKTGHPVNVARYKDSIIALAKPHDYILF